MLLAYALWSFFLLVVPDQGVSERCPNALFHNPVFGSNAGYGIVPF